jgi:metallophosphoesterase superfamily enzyme
VGDGGIAEKLFRTVEELAPAEVVFLGDSVHAPKPSAAEREHIEATLNRLEEMVKVTVVEGNHDRAFHRDFGHRSTTIARQWRHGEFLGLHGDRLHVELPEAAHYLIGHFHPAIGIRDAAGARRRAPVFLSGPRATVLPAFSPFAAGFDISRSPLPDALAELLGEYGSYDVVVNTGRRIARLPAKALSAIRSDR